MNKKAEELLKRKSSVARIILGDKKHYENRIVEHRELENKEKDDYMRGLNGGVQIGFQTAAFNCKRTLERILMEVK